MGGTRAKIWLAVPLFIIGSLFVAAAVTGVNIDAQPADPQSIYVFKSAEGYIYGPICLLLGLIIIAKRP